MSSHLYVCLFSTGHIKVGRTTRPGARVEQHAQRVGVVGVRLVSALHFECQDQPAVRERALIDACVVLGGKQICGEWFAELDHKAACEAAQHAATMQIEEARSLMTWQQIIAEIQSLSSLTQPQIAAMCGAGQATIGDLSRGKTQDPSYSLGEALKSLLERCRAGEFASSKVA